MFTSSRDVHAMKSSAPPGLRPPGASAGWRRCPGRSRRRSGSRARSSERVDVDDRQVVLVVERLDDRRAHLPAPRRRRSSRRRRLTGAGGYSPRSVPRRRRRQQGLERVLGAPGAVRDRLRQRRLVDLLRARRHRRLRARADAASSSSRGLIFAATAATYAEGTVRYPEAGGSSSFARHAFNELVSFGAAWAQMLVYVATVTISAFFVPHYLSIFWEPLTDEPLGHRRRRGDDRRPGRGQHRRGQGGGDLNVSLAVVDFATQLLLVVLGFFLVFSPRSSSTTSTGSRADVAQLPDRGPDRDARLHGRRDGVEPRRGGARSGADRAERVQADGRRGLRDLLHAPGSRCRRCRWQQQDGEHDDVLGCRPEEGGFRTTRCSESSRTWA